MASPLYKPLEHLSIPLCLLRLTLRLHLLLRASFAVLTDPTPCWFACLTYRRSLLVVLKLCWFFNSCDNSFTFVITHLSRTFLNLGPALVFDQYLLHLNRLWCCRLRMNLYTPILTEELLTGKSNYGNVS